jgi:2',3'-cyclic-nucleotide 2'-phosphodiesterase
LCFSDAAGQASLVLMTANAKIAVLNVQGRTFMQPMVLFTWLYRGGQLRQETSTLIVDMHAETASAQIATGRFLDGKVFAVMGDPHLRPESR